MKKFIFYLNFITLMLMAVKVNGGCYFSPELQGVYRTQNIISNNEVKFSEMNITADEIPIVGHCHRRINNNVILLDGTEETSCYRCFNLRLVARSVLRIHTDKEYIAKCYTNEEKAMKSCPSQETEIIDTNKHTEIMLYKTHEYNGQPIRREYCPINGVFKLTLNIDDGTEDKIECPQLTSRLDTCPSGSTMNLRFEQCSFENLEVIFQCLGHWQDHNNQNYLALTNTLTIGTKLGPQYRCAIYDENKINGIITMSFSNDSTCLQLQKQEKIKNVANNIIHNEIITLHPIPQKFKSMQYCRNNFTNWMLGHWEHLIITNDTIIYKDHSSFKTYTMKCIENYLNSNRYIVFSLTQCGEQKYHCVAIKQRSDNILEFQMGLKSSLNFSSALCNNKHFDDNLWLTQARLDHNKIISPCPVNGNFTGKIPDADEGSLCAKLSSDCQSPDIMYYQVSDCDTNEIYEEREYRCLGQWSENGLMYTYTQRSDVGTYECFVGAVITNNQIFIKEAGEDCQRNVNPYKYGMELKKTAFCTTKNGRPYVATSKQFETTTLQQDTKYLSTDARINKEQNDTNEDTTKPSSSTKSSANLRYNKKMNGFFILIIILIFNI